jgi:zona occludens toxin
MIIFHEGLPRSGKSYEAVVKHILPAINSGRHVYSNINGLYEGAEKIAALINSQVEYVQSLIHTLTEEEVYKLQDVVPKDAMICLDEIQNYYPSGRQTLPKETIKYVAEHGHHGHDIILMGQSFADVAPLWRRRTQRKVMFMKKTAIGKPDEYKWTAYEAQAPEVFQKISSGGGKYDSKYFGTYKSHQDGTKNTTFAYEDDRTNIFKQKNMILGVPAFIAVFIFAVTYLYSFFQEPSFVNAPEPVEPPKIQKAVYTPPPKPELKQQKQTQSKQIKAEYIPIDYLDKIAQKYQLRLSAYILDKDEKLQHALIDAYDTTQHLKERFYLQDIQALGWDVTHQVYGLDIKKQNVTYVVRPFPLHDLYGSVNKHTAESL